MNEPAAGAPNAPVDVSTTAVSVTSVLLLWNSPPASNTNCPPVAYNIKITAACLCQDPIVINTTNNATNITVSGLTLGLEYFVTITGLDAGNRMGVKSVPIHYTVNCRFGEGYQGCHCHVACFKITTEVTL